MEKIEENKFAQMSFSFELTSTDAVQEHQNTNSHASERALRKCMILNFPIDQKTEANEQDLILRILQRSKGFAE